MTSCCSVGAGRRHESPITHPTAGSVPLRVSASFTTSPSPVGATQTGPRQVLLCRVCGWGSPARRVHRLHGEQETGCPRGESTSFPKFAHSKHNPERQPREGWRQHEHARMCGAHGGLLSNGEHACKMRQEVLGAARRARVCTRGRTSVQTPSLRTDVCPHLLLYAGASQDRLTANYSSGCPRLGRRDLLGV